MEMSEAARNMRPLPAALLAARTLRAISLTLNITNTFHEFQSAFATVARPTLEFLLDEARLA